MIKIKLKDKSKVVVDSFSYSYTYSGVLAGKPNEEMNRRVFEGLNYPRNWGERKCLKIPPELNDFTIPLKHVCYCVWLNSLKPIEPNNFASNLIVIWLGDEPNNRTIEEIIENGVKNIDWQANAEDYRL